MVLAQFARWLEPDPDQLLAHSLYVSLVEQSRKPFFYTRLGVPDTLDGRFELIVLHLSLLLLRIQNEENAKAQAMRQYLAEVFFGDMDRSLRELGVADTGMKKRIKAITGAFYGRLDAYERGLEHPDDLKDTIRRNVYGTSLEQATSERAEAFTTYCLRAASALAETPVEMILKGKLPYPRTEEEQNLTEA